MVVVAAIGLAMVGSVMLWSGDTLVERLHLFVRGICDQRHDIVIGSAEEGSTTG